MRPKHLNAILWLALSATCLCAQGLPKGAKQVAPGEYQVTNKEGKTEIWRRGPFGYQRMEVKAAEEPAADPNASAETPAGGEVRDAGQPAASQPSSGSGVRARQAAPSGVKITDLGDSVRIERPTPFGTSRRIVKKSELTEEEKKLWQDHQNAESGSAQNNAK